MHTPADAGERLFALVTDETRVAAVDSLLTPDILAALPATPVSTLRFFDGTEIDMQAALLWLLEYSAATVMGSEGDDRLFGSGEGDVIESFAGNDYIEVLGGRNTIEAGAGDDEIRLSGENTVDAGSGDDVISGSGNNVLDGGAGDDHFFLSGNNVVRPGPGTDTVFLSGGDNILCFGPGDGIDYLSFDTGTEGGAMILELGEGATIENIKVYRYPSANEELLQVSLAATRDSLFLQPLVYAAAADAFIPNPQGTLAGVRFSDGRELSGEQLVALSAPPPDLFEGTPGSDRITGSGRDDLIIGGQGDDRLWGEGGSDIFLVEGVDQGTDRVVGGEGYDMLVGGPGDDTFSLSGLPLAFSIEEIDGGAGVNTISGTAHEDRFNFSATRLRNITRILGGAGNDRITGSQGDDVIVGGAGNDVLKGEGGNDVFLVTGRDQGMDRIVGGEGYDVIRGSAGDDTFTFSVVAAGFTIEEIDGAGGYDVIAGTAGDNHLNLSHTVLTAIALIAGGNGDDRILGSPGNDRITGGQGDDVLRGEAGDDILQGVRAMTSCREPRVMTRICLPAVTATTGSIIMM
ncbi:MAG: calcium-binding protein [Halioglobus sp.]